MEGPDRSLSNEGEISPVSIVFRHSSSTVDISRGFLVFLREEICNAGGKLAALFLLFGPLSESGLSNIRFNGGRRLDEGCVIADE